MITVIAIIKAWLIINAALLAISLLSDGEIAT